MTWSNAGRHRIDRLFLTLNTLCWFSAAALVFYTPAGISLSIGCLVVALASCYGFMLCQSQVRYFGFVQRFISVLRIAQAAILMLSCTVPMARDQMLWVLFVPLILADTLVEKSSWRSIGLATVASFLFIFSALLQYQPLVDCIVPITFLASTVLIASILGGFREREELLITRNQRMKTLMDTASKVATQDLRSLLDQALQAVIVDLGASSGIIVLESLDEDGVLTTEAKFAIDGNLTAPATMRVGEGATGLAVFKRETVTTGCFCDECLSQDGRSDEADGLISVPLIARTKQRIGRVYEERAIGALTLSFTHQGDSVDEEDLTYIHSLGALLAAAVCNQRSEARQRRTFLRTMKSLAIALEARDDYTRGHSQRVCEVSMLLGARLGLSVDQLEELRIGTTLHDIGKIGVPDAILNKPGRLSSEEFEVMREHPAIGYDICLPLELGEGILKIIRNHHERLDGIGYPDHLVGEELTLPLRIVCVADAFDAMSSPRPYRPVAPIDAVLEELFRCAGKQFDLAVVTCLRDLAAEGAFDVMYRSYWQSVSDKAA